MIICLIGRLLRFIRARQVGSIDNKYLDFLQQRSDKKGMEIGMLGADKKGYL